MRSICRRAAAIRGASENCITPNVVRKVMPPVTLTSARETHGTNIESAAPARNVAPAVIEAVRTACDWNHRSSIIRPPLCDKLIADTLHGVDIIAAQLVAGLAYVHIDRAVNDMHVLSPDVIQTLLLGKDSAGVRRQVIQEFELLPREA